MSEANSHGLSSDGSFAVGYRGAVHQLSHSRDTPS
jgi:hypothetical protein